MPVRRAKFVPEKITTIYEEAVSQSVRSKQIEKINSESLSLIRNINLDMRNRIEEVLKRGVREGKSVSATASKLLATGLDRGAFRSARKRCWLIARTELHRARQMAAKDIYEANDINFVKWIAIEDSRRCKTCRRKHNKVYRIDKLINWPPLHPRCRCRVVPASFKFNIKVKHSKKGKVVEAGIAPNPNDYKYIIKLKKSLEDLEKTKPYTRVKRGKLERVRGYLGRVSIKKPGFWGDNWNQIPPFIQGRLNRLYKTDAMVWEGYTIGQHANMVLNQFNKYFSGKKLPLLGEGIVRDILSLHDIGKGKAIDIEGDKAQHYYNAEIIKSVFSYLPYSDKQTNIAEALVSEDWVGSYIKGVRTLNDVANDMDRKSFELGVSLKEFYELCKVIYMSDSSAYTKDAGGKESLDYLFEFGPNKLEFKGEAKKKVEELDQAIEAKKIIDEYPLYHGTSEDRMASILEKGLIQQKYHNFENDLWNKKVRERSVYVAESFADAAFFADVASEGIAEYAKEGEKFVTRGKPTERGRPIIIEVNVPGEYFDSHRITDEEWCGKAFLLPTVKPEWISKVYKKSRTLRLLEVIKYEEYNELTDKEKKRIGDEISKKNYDLIWDRLRKAKNIFTKLYVPISYENFLKLSKGKDLEKSYEYSSTQVEFPSGLADRILQLGNFKVDKGDLHPTEKQDDAPHITVRYGLHTTDSEKVEKILKDVKSIKASILGVDIFQPEEKDYDVLVLRVDSPELSELNRKLGKLPNTDTFPIYQPHSTICYLKRGLGEKYRNLVTGLEGVKLEFGNIVFSPSKGGKVSIDLEKSEARVKGFIRTRKGKFETVRPYMRTITQMATELVRDKKVTAEKYGVEPKNLVYSGLQSFVPFEDSYMHLWTIIKPGHERDESTVTSSIKYKVPSKDLKKDGISMEEAVGIIRKMPSNLMDGWFRNGDKNYKKPLVDLISSNPDIKSAGLKVMHYNYEAFTGKKLPYNEFINKDITLYRGGGVSKGAFTSYTIDRDIAKKWGKVEEIKIKPRDTLGSYQTIAETEILVPNKEEELVTIGNKPRTNFQKKYARQVILGQRQIWQFPGKYGDDPKKGKEIEIPKEIRTKGWGKPTEEILYELKRAYDVSKSEIGYVYIQDLIDLTGMDKLEVYKTIATLVKEDRAVYSVDRWGQPVSIKFKPETWVTRVKRENEITVQDVDRFLDKVTRYRKYGSAKSDEEITLSVLSDYADKPDVKKYLEFLSKIANDIDNKLSEGGVSYDQDDLKFRLMSREITSDEDSIYPVPVYVSAKKDEATVGLLIHKDGKFEMFEGNDEATPDTLNLVNDLLGVGDKKVKVWTSQSHEVAEKIREGEVPEGIFVSPKREVAEGYWGEGRQLVSFKMSLKDLAQHSEIDWQVRKTAKLEPEGPEGTYEYRLATGKISKARPYTRIRGGKLEHVKGYPHKPRIFDLSYEKRVEKALDPNREDVQISHRIAYEVNSQGGRALIVGGFVRDALIGKPSKDIDVEVYGLDPDKLQNILQRVGKVDSVGASFGVLKVSTPTLEEPLDVSIPRRDSKIGLGHKGFKVTNDPTMTSKEAAQRRDLTINSIAYDPLKREIIDEFGGLQDVKDRKLRATDPKTFVEDPLRVLRVMQFAARFEFAPDTELVKTCRTMDLSSLPKERIYSELEKLLLKSKDPSIGVRLIPILGIDKVLPEIESMRGVPQEKLWHPEGSVFAHTLQTVKEAAKKRKMFDNKNDKMVFMLSALCHDMGKPATTSVDAEGKIISHGHEEVGGEVTRKFLERITNEVDIIDRVDMLVRNHMAPTSLYQGKAGDGAIRRLAKKIDIPMLIALSTVDKLGRGTEANLRAERWLTSKYKKLKLGYPDTLAPKVKGRHLLPLGIPPGPEMGRILDKIYSAQLEGKFEDVEGGLNWARKEELIKAIPVKGFTRTKSGKLERVSPYWKEGDIKLAPKGKMFRIYRGDAATVDLYPLHGKSKVKSIKILKDQDPKEKILEQEIKDIRREERESLEGISKETYDRWASGGFRSETEKQEYLRRKKVDPEQEVTLRKLFALKSSKLVIDLAKSRKNLVKIRKSGIEGKRIPYKYSGKTIWAKVFDGDIVVKGNLKDVVYGSKILVKSKIAKITGIGRDGCTARDKDRRKYEVLYKNLNLLV